ncbi:hypothetical protein ABZX30_37725 [Streptomyces sp. NPDC004542]|uniref:hypothetical protein n=1 Tax=Streptomyces sp. NPDC004542 TaxID=3154281 RepID=UPI0033BD8C14
MPSITDVESVKSAIIVYLFGATIAAIYTAYTAIMGWIGFGKQAVRFANWVSITVIDVRNTARSMTRIGRVAAFAMSFVIGVIIAAWLFVIKVTADGLVNYFHEDGPRPKGAIGPSTATWHGIANVYFTAAVIVVIIYIFVAHEASPYGPSILLAIPTLAWAIPGILKFIFFDVMIGFFEWLDGRYHEHFWADLAFGLSPVAVSLITFGALASAQNLGNLWMSRRSMV